MVYSALSLGSACNSVMAATAITSPFRHIAPQRELRSAGRIAAPLGAVVPFEKLVMRVPLIDVMTTGAGGAGSLEVLRRCCAIVLPCAAFTSSWCGPSSVIGRGCFISALRPVRVIVMGSCRERQR